MAAVVSLSKIASRSFLKQSLRPVILRSITTSKKNNETAVVTEKISSHSASQADIDSVASAAKQKWGSYGFSYEDQVEDVATAHLLSFVSITLCIVGGAVWYTYSPDRTLKDWAQREAYLTVRQREAEGLPLIDPNYADVSKMVLPSEEELGNTDIII